jgi:PTS system nitrogen regulatory IIA component
MNWNLREAARALNIPEREVLRLVREGALPACRVNDQYLFNAVELQEWATQRNRKMAVDVIPPNAEPPHMLSLAGAIERGGVHYNLSGTSRNDVLEAVAQLPGIPSHVDRALLGQVLRTREGLASTGIGGGIAIPHPRDPVVLQLDSPIILLCFLAQGVDFKAIDGRPVRVLFTLLSPTIPLHLHMLSRLAYVLHDDLLNQRLGERASQDAILARVQELETRMNGSKRDGQR